MEDSWPGIKWRKVLTFKFFPTAYHVILQKTYQLEIHTRERDFHRV